MIPLSSRERLLAVMRYQEADYVPLMLYPFGFRPWWTKKWSDDQVDQAEAFLDFGLDAWLGVGPPMTFHPDVKTYQRTETRSGDRWPCMIRGYDTPVGTFRQEVFLTQDWEDPQWPEHRDGPPTVSLLDDYNVPRFRACPIQGEQDLEKLKYLYRPITDEEISAFRQEVEATAKEARRLGVLLRGDASSGTDAAVWLCGVQGLLDMAIDRPEMLAALLDIIHRRDKRTVEVLLDTPVDLIMRRGYYEGMSFWSPDIYRRFFLPRVKELTDLVHQGGRLMGYTMSVGYMPLLETLAEIGYDMHFLLDPIVPGSSQRVDLAAVKAAWRGRISVVGAINQPITLQRGSRQNVREEVFHSVDTLGPGGLCLTPVEAVYSFTPTASLEAMIEAWREVRDRR